MTTTKTPGPARTTALFVLLWITWVLAPAGLALAAFGQVLTFFGESPTAAEQAAADRYTALAVLALIGVPLTGLFLGVQRDRRHHVVAFAVAAVLGALVSLPLIWFIGS